MCLKKYVFFSALLLVVTGCEDEKKSQQMPPQLVGIAKAIKKNIPFEIEVPAKITGSLEIQVRAQVGGILKSRLFQEGEYVKEGEKLFEIEQEQYKAALTRANGELAQAESEVRRTNRDYTRMQKLHKVNAISQKEHDDSLSAYERAQANLKVAEGLVREAEINLSYTDVKAPISGIVGKEARSVGNLISANSESSLLTSMVKISPLHANFSISGSTWNTLAKGHIDGKVKLLKFDDYEVEIIMSDGTKYPEHGKIIFVDSSEDNLTSSVSIKAEIPSDEKQKILLPGQFVRVHLVGVEYQDLIVIPSSALISTEFGYAVYVVKKDNTVESRRVHAELSGNCAIVESGLEEDEDVVCEGIAKIRPGQKVNTVLKIDSDKS